MALTPFKASLKKVVGEKEGLRRFIGELETWWAIALGNDAKSSGGEVADLECDVATGDDVGDDAGEDDERM